MALNYVLNNAQLVRARNAAHPETSARVTAAVQLMADWHPDLAACSHDHDGTTEFHAQVAKTPIWVTYTVSESNKAMTVLAIEEIEPAHAGQLAS